jgi:argininosuccinate lyase/amino-acid N-acetyltransferase
MTQRGGRFEGAVDPLFTRINDSLPFDWRLAQHDIRGSIAWVEALRGAAVLSDDEARRLTEGLEALAAEAAADPASLRTSGCEDIHTWVESRLTELLGDVARRLHTGRSRNDQVATDLRLFVRHELAERIRELRDVQAALLSLARREAETVFPGYTHLQRAQPILFAHWCLAYFEMLDRDAGRLAAARARANRCPLGSGALAGTAYDIDRERLARALEFDAPTANSLDAVSDRDFVLETLSAASITAIHLSRLAEDLVLYSSAEFGLVSVPDALASGSSLMPQKKNPDALELIRAKCGRISGAFVSLSMVLKGLPLSYNKDLQEDKEPLFDAIEHLSLSLRLLVPLLEGLSVDRDAARRAAAGGYSNATDLADHLVQRGVSFREAHEQVGRVVRHALGRGLPLEGIDPQDMRAFAPAVGSGVHAELTVDASLRRRHVPGGTAPERVHEAIREAAVRLARQRTSGLEIRAARLDELDDVYRLVEYWARQGENLPRTREAVLEAIADFAVAVHGGAVIGCASLSIYTDSLAEVRSLGVAPDYHGGGAGSGLVRHLLQRAAKLHIPRVFALTRAPGFFERLGFRRVNKDELPEKVWKDCRLCPKRQSCDETAVVYEVMGGA